MSLYFTLTTIISTQAASEEKPVKAANIDDITSDAFEEVELSVEAIESIKKPIHGMMNIHTSDIMQRMFAV